MDDQEKKYTLSKFSHIFRNEENYYNKKILRSGKTFDLEDESFFRQVNIALKRMLGNVEGKKVLDIGCGRGNISFYLARKGAIDFRVMNAQIPDFENKTFDIIVGSRIIHHLPDIELFFRECKRLLKKKGFITFIEPLKKNPIVEMNRRHLNPKKRTTHEHPLLLSEILKAKKIFGNIMHAEYYIISPSTMLFKIFFRKPRIFRVLYKFLQYIEFPLYKINFLRQYCWQTVFKSIKS